MKLFNCLKINFSLGYTQLKLLTKENFAAILPKLLPHEWTEASRVTWTPGVKGHPDWDWLEDTWDYLSSHCVDDLWHFENLPLIPCETENKLELVAFSNSAMIVVKEYDGLSLDNGVEEILEKLDIVVVKSLPIYIKKHPMVLGKYVKSPSYVGILNVLVVLEQNLGSNFTEDFRMLTSNEDKECLRALFGHAMAHNLKPDHYTMLRDLPVFQAVPRDEKEIDEPRFVAASEVPTTAPRELLSVPLSKDLLNVSDQDSFMLASLLELRVLTLCQMLTEIIFPDIEEAFYEPYQVEKIMVHVLKRFQSFLDEDPKFLERVKSLAFLPRGDMFVTADRFFEPDSELLQKLFYGEENFPQGIYSEPSLVAVLRQVGLRGGENIDPEDLLETARVIEDYSNDENYENVESLAVKSDTLLHYLSNHMDLLKADCEEKTLLDHLIDIKWVKVQRSKPAFYPESLPWFSESCIVEKPNAVRLPEHAALTGAVCPILGSKPSIELSQLLGWNQELDRSSIINHLSNVVQFYNTGEKAKFMDIAVQIYSELQKWDSAEFQELLQAHGLSIWVWDGEGFAHPSDIIVSKPFTDLRPYLYSVPTEVDRFMDLFVQNGVKETVYLPSILLKISERYKDGKPRHEAEVKRDLNLSIAVLNELKSVCNMEELEAIQKEIVLPLHASTRVKLQMAPLRDCTYCDQEWWRQGHDLDDLSDLSEDEEHKIMLVHHDIPMSTLEALGVPTLMSRMLDVEEIDISFGQSDSLTHRLNVLLQDYTDGFAVPKELVQNADDAGATDVKLLYDERENRDAMSCLIDENMRECQGPALWAYNNAVFTDEDFENITKLAGATKENETDKIGRFGLGFNAVYNITDVPSFVSRHNIVIFDPHTKHLGRSIKNKSKPGIKIDMRKHRKKLKRLGNQFKPYNDIFGCNLRPQAKHDAYNATLFRFPLRTKAQAAVSEICQRHYDDHEVKMLLTMLEKGAEFLLLFTQNVQNVSVYHIPKGTSDVSRISPVFAVTKRPVRILRELQWTGELSDQVKQLGNFILYSKKQ